MKLYRQQLFIEVSSHWELVTSTFLVIDRSCNNKFVTTELVVHCRKSQVTYAVTGMKTYKNVNCVQKIKCVKVRALFPENKVRFARAEQVLWFSGAPVGWMMKCTCIATVRNGGVEWTTADDAGINPPPQREGVDPRVICSRPLHSTISHSAPPYDSESVHRWRAYSNRVNTPLYTWGPCHVELECP